MRGKQWRRSTRRKMRRQHYLADLHAAIPPDAGQKAHKKAASVNLDGTNSDVVAKLMRIAEAKEAMAAADPTALAER